MTTTNTNDDATTPANETDANNDAGASDDSSAKANAEAAKYRRRLRDTETERDTLASQLEAMRRQHVEHLAADGLADPADIWRDAELDDLLDDDGQIATDKVADIVGAVLAERPHLAASRRPKPDMSQGARGGSSESTAERFQGAFAPTHQRLQ